MIWYFVLISDTLFYDLILCLLIWYFVLWSYYLSYDHIICLMICYFVLWSDTLSYHLTICLMILSFVLWSYHFSYDLIICLMILSFVLWSSYLQCLTVAVVTLTHLMRAPTLTALALISPSSSSQPWTRTPRTGWSCSSWRRLALYSFVSVTANGTL